jgi:hypothetical protein
MISGEASFLNTAQTDPRANTFMTAAAKINIRRVFLRKPITCPAPPVFAFMDLREKPTNQQAPPVSMPRIQGAL